MSGTAGLFGQGDPQQINRLEAALSRRSAGSVTVWKESKACLMGATRRYLPGAWPDRVIDGLRLSGDLRLDNRAELAGAIQCAATAETNDAEIFAAAYRRWGRDAFARMRGDFAVAIWDEAAAELSLVRDPLGVRPLFYRANDHEIVFSSDTRALHNGPMDGDAEIAFFLAGIATYDRDITQGVSRVMPGEVLVWRAGRGTLHFTYWQPATESSGADETDEQQEARFRELFERVVSDRIRAGENVAAMLSGGLDSSSVAVVAERLRSPMPVYCNTYPSFPALDERRYIDAVCECGDFRRVDLDHDETQPLRQLAAVIEEQDGLFPAPGLPVSRKLYQRASADGVQVLLDGHGGDEVVWLGMTRLVELAAQRRWGTVLALLPTYSRLFGDDPVTALSGLMSLHPPRGLLGSSIKRAVTRIAALRSRDATRRNGAAPEWQGLVHRNFMRRFDLEERWRVETRLPDACRSSDQANHLRAICAPLFARSFEVLDRTSAAAGVEVRYPFCDRDLITFCLGLPASAKLRRGESRSILRRALAGILPRAVARRQDKTDFTGFVRSGIGRHHTDLLDAMERDAGGFLGEVMEMDALRTLIGAYRASPGTFDGARVQLLWRAAVVHTLLSSR